MDPCLDTNLEPRDTKDSNKSPDNCSPRQSPAHTGPSYTRCFKKNISGSANVSRDGGANNTVNNNTKIEEEAPITTAGI